MPLTKTYSRKPPKRVLDDDDNEANEEDLPRKRQRGLTASHPPSSSSSASSAFLSSDAHVLWSSDAPDGENISPPSSPSSEPASRGKSANETTIDTTTLAATEPLMRQRPAPLVPPPPPPTAKRTLRVHRRRNSPPPVSRSVLRTVIDTNASNNTSSRGSKVTSRLRPTRLTQLQIDLGGEVRKTCSGCGMDYIPSNLEDAGLHKTFHARHLKGIQLGAGSTTARQNHHLRNHLARGWILDVEPSRRLKDLERDDEDMGADYAILMVDRRSSTAEKAKAVMALDVVNADLSASDIDEARLWGKVLSASSSSLGVVAAASNSTLDKTDKHHQTDRFKVYLYLYQGRCIGLCLAEHITRGYRVISTSDHQPIITNDVDDHEVGSHGRRRQQGEKEENHSWSWSSSISIDRDQAHEAILGISRIWTSRAYRRRGIATCLLEWARRSFVYGLVVAKDRVAFSQPSQSGKALAEAWFGVDGGGHEKEMRMRRGRDWLVYVEE